MSSLYESNNNNSEPNSNEFWYDKNEFYTENGLSRGQKKDRKSHGKKAREQQEQREDKVAKQVLLLPKKMQKALKALDKDKEFSVKEVANPQKVKQVKYIKTITRKGKKDDLALSLEDVEEDDEALGDYDQGVRMWQLRGLTEAEYLDNMEKEMQVRSENLCFDDEEDEDEDVVNDYKEYNETYINYINAKREFQMYSEQWSEKELLKFKEIIDSYEALSEYERGVRMWQSYGLSEAQYAAHQEKELNIDSLFEDWYYDEEHQDAIYAQEDQADAEYANWLEAKEEERREHAMQNCIDDMCD